MSASRGRFPPPLQLRRKWSYGIPSPESILLLIVKIVPTTTSKKFTPPHTPPQVALRGKWRRSKSFPLRSQTKLLPRKPFVFPLYLDLTGPSFLFFSLFVFPAFAIPFAGLHALGNRCRPFPTPPVIPTPRHHPTFLTSQEAHLAPSTLFFMALFRSTSNFTFSLGGEPPPPLCDIYNLRVVLFFLPARR